jgi:hypothetical protein
VAQPKRCPALLVTKVPDDHKGRDVRTGSWIMLAPCGGVEGHAGPHQPDSTAEILIR